MKPFVDNDRLFMAGYQDGSGGLVYKRLWLAKTFDNDDWHHYESGYRRGETAKINATRTLL